jgi:hypothetical protein
MSVMQARILLGIYPAYYELFVPGWVASSEIASLEFTVKLGREDRNTRKAKQKHSSLSAFFSI